MYEEGSDPSGVPVGIGGLIAGSFRLLWRDRTVVGMVALAYTLIALTLYFAMPITPGSPFGSPPDRSVSIAQLALSLLLFPIYLIIAAGIFMLMARLVALGKEQLFAGGLNALTGRTFRVLWRMICAMGWILLAVLALMLVMALVSFLIGIVANAFGGSVPMTAGILPLLLWVVLMVFIFPFYVIINFAVISESLDVPMPVKTSFGILRGSLAKPAIATAILYIGTLLLMVGGFGGWLVMGGSFDPMTAFLDPESNGLNFFSIMSAVLSAFTVIVYYCFVAITAIATQKKLGIELPAG